MPAATGEITPCSNAVLANIYNQPYPVHADSVFGPLVEVLAGELASSFSNSPTAGGQYTGTCRCSVLPHTGPSPGLKAAAVGRWSVFVLSGLASS